MLVEMINYENGLHPTDGYSIIAKTKKFIDVVHK